jgi:O-succinylbenzoic acid--CoA ligase
MAVAGSVVRSWMLASEAAPPAVAGIEQPWRWWLPGVAGALAWLAGHGLKAGMRIGLAGGNLPSCAALLQAAPLAGITTVLFNRRLSSAALGAQLRRSACTALVAVPGGSGADAGPPALLLPDDFAAGGGHPPLAPLQPEQAALVLFSSGTSGEPKAVRLSMGALCAAAAAAVERLRLVRGDHWLGCLPLDHIGGASLVLRAGLCGYALTLVERFDAAAVDLLLGRGATGISVVPTMLHRLVDARAGRPWPPRLRLLLTGGAALAPELAQAASRLGLPACETYGLSEAASQVCTSVPSAASPGSCGPPLPGMQLRIRGSDGVLAGSGESGIIEIAGDALFDGYEEGGELVHRHPRGAWFTTSDLGTVDGAGRLSVQGRYDDLINSGGEKINPGEVELVLERHPAILEAGVHGAPDAQWGELVSAVLVARGEPPGAAELEAWCRERLGGFRCPRAWRFVAQLPRTAAGKLQRRRLAAWQLPGDPSVRPA